MSREPGRSLFLKLWYPAQPAPGTAPEVLWDQLHAARRIPLVSRALLKLIQRRTTTYSGAARAATVPPLWPVLYNHGLVSFASENTSLTQDLASRGHIVIAIEHRDQLAEFRALGRQQPPGERRLAHDLAARIKRADAKERAALASELYAASANTNRIVLERARDTLFALDHLSAILAVIPGQEVGEVSPSSLHLVGYSVGGAVSTLVAGWDRRVVSVGNIDGGLYGSHGANALTAAYLMIYSAASESINDELLPQHATRLTAANTRHLNYHDIAGLLPALRWIRAIGSAEPGSVLRWRNQQVAAFLERASCKPR